MRVYSPKASKFGNKLLLGGGTNSKCSQLEVEGSPLFETFEVAD
jgi:hypothetical protein